MFRKKKDKKGDDIVLSAPNINDDNDAMWFDPKGSMVGGGPVPTPAMGVPPAPPNGFRMSVSPNLKNKKSPNTSSSSERKRYSVNDLVAAINFNDWGTVMQIIDKDPKVAGKNTELTLKGQKTEGNALLLLVVANPPVEVVERMIKAYPSGASNTDRQGNRTALHWACIANASPGVLQAVIDANSSACRSQDRKFERTPLHYLAIIAEDAEQVQVLMEAEKRAALVKDIDQKTPLELAHDSTNPAKMDIVAALQRKRSSSINMFSAFKSSSKSRAASPGKYKSREATTANSLTAPLSPPRSPGKYSSRKSSAVHKSPGKHRSREGSSRGRRTVDGDREGSSRGRRTVDGDREGSSRHHKSSRSDRRESRKPRDSRSDAKGGEVVAPPTQLKQSQSLNSGDLSAPPSRSVSPVPTRSRSPIPSVTPPEPPIVPSSPVFTTPAAAATTPDRTITTSRPPSQSLPAGMDGEMRTLRDKLERKKHAVEMKDREIAQMNDQIEDNNQDIAALYSQAQGGTTSSAKSHSLSEKRDKIQRLKDKIAELQAELRRAEQDVQRMESASGDGGNVDMTYIQDQIQMKEEERSSLQFVKEALVQEKMAALREVENVESEIKSLETIQMLAQSESNIG